MLLSQTMAVCKLVPQILDSFEKVIEDISAYTPVGTAAVKSLQV